MNKLQKINTVSFIKKDFVVKLTENLTALFFILNKHEKAVSKRIHGYCLKFSSNKKTGEYLSPVYYFKILFTADIKSRIDKSQ